MVSSHQIPRLRPWGPRGADPNPVSDVLNSRGKLPTPPMTPGGLLLRLRQKFGHGLRTAWYRDVVRPRILRTPPVVGTTDKRCEIHVLTSAGDWLNLLWTLKSFYAASRRKYALCIHDDGSLSNEARNSVQAHFPAARLIARTEA